MAQKNLREVESGWREMDERWWGFWAKFFIHFGIEQLE